MVIHPNKKKEYFVQKLKVTKRFESLSEVSHCIASTLKCSDISQVGYIEPGHGVKGKQHWLMEDYDLQDMYACKSNSILFWCFNPQLLSSSSEGTRPRKRHAEESEVQPQSKRDAYAKKISDVEDIVKKLEDKHGSKYTVEEMNAWAHMVHVKKRTSCDVPPNLPYFTGNKKRVADAGTTAVDTQAFPSGATNTSPSKRVNLRSECITQLDKWHSLLEKGAINQVQFDELQKTILKDIFGK